jgi:hypothetical protein
VPVCAGTMGVPMSGRLPLLIGITGKRQFSTDAEADKRYEKHLRCKLTEIFATLDKEYPRVPKILLTGAAYGTDLIAAHTALAQNSATNAKSWAVVALLPFEQKEFEEDFKTENNTPQDKGWPDRYAAHLRSFESLIGGAKDDSARVIVRTLPKLDANLPPGDTRPPATKSDLDGPEPRNWYYEQVGQFIAESSNILIAVMPQNTTANPDEATGGTARIVAYRRVGRPDEIGMRVAERSAILRRKWPDLAAPSNGFVWLLEPKDKAADSPPAEGSKNRCRGTLFGMKYWWEVGPYPVEVLSPVERYDFRMYPPRPAECRSLDHEHEPGPLRQIWRTARYAVAWAHIIRPLSAAVHQHWLKASLTSAKALKIFNNHEPTTPEIIAEAGDIANLTQDSGYVADLISKTQIRQNAKSKNSFRWLAGLFVGALVTFEVYAKFFSSNALALVAYLLFLAAIAFVVIRARWNLSQAKSEDYRAVAEMMRVQHAWWSAGLAERVDREHLQGVDRELARIRDGATGLIAWLLIRHRLNKPEVKWHEVRGTSATARKKEEKEGSGEDWADWIGSQLAYFSSKEKDRLDYVHKSDAISWTLFMASAFMAVILCAWLVDGWAWHDRHPIYHFFLGVASALAMDGAVVNRLGAVLVWALVAVTALRFRVANRDLTGIPSMIATVLLGCIVAILLSLAVVSAAPLLAAPEGDHLHIVPAKSLMMVVLVGLSAAAGAWRYLTERLNIEAEAHEYRDAKERFERAEHLLVADLNDEGKLRNEERAQELIRDLGRLALTENEAWLKSRRERPLTPVVG